MFFSPPQYGTTPLIWASRKGHYESVMHLLANGADVDQEGAVSKPLIKSLYCYVLCTVFYVTLHLLHDPLNLLREQLH